MAFTTLKVGVKLSVGGLALYGLSEILSSQDDAMKHLSMLDNKTRENIPAIVSLPEVSSGTQQLANEPIIFAVVRNC